MIETKDTEQLEVQRIIDNAKKEFKNVYETKIADEVIIWRPLKRKEYKEIMTSNEDDNLSDRELVYLREELLAKKVILYPENVDDIIEDIAGVAEIISSECMEKTGFGLDSKTTKL